MQPELGYRSRVELDDLLTPVQLAPLHARIVGRVLADIHQADPGLVFLRCRPFQGTRMRDTFGLLEMMQV